MAFGKTVSILIPNPSVSTNPTAKLLKNFRFWIQTGVRQLKQALIELPRRVSPSFLL